jgi:cellulase
MMYMANCGKSCDGVKPGGLDWFKIGQEGFHDGQWPNDRLSKSNEWGSQFTLPTNLPSGKYLLAHHMLALHSLGDPQFYPVAFQIDLKSSGTANPQPKG